MKYKKGNPITSVDDLVGELKNSEAIYFGKIHFLSDEIFHTSLITIYEGIENRNFFYAVEDDE